MLKTSKTINLSGNSIINDKQVVYMQANISTDGGTTSHSSSIQDKELYEVNKVECRQDMAAFDQMVYEIEDSIHTEAAQS
ncbi:hypothetical protein DWX41_20820 [Hungatella hathewayi]|uniref:Uncharacterized protein n=1 Tax=Hungatella hathewayi TaxID=154046 RepID=A0A3E2WES0_9FIRM|nr:hypothetical protein [Hungatella hathewayi]RGC24855.1 hypothetical protein DWX41_20820 [Hungatella hathewayi]